MPNTKPVGVAFSDPELVSGTTITGAVITGSTLNAVTVGSTGGTAGFFGTSPVSKGAALTTALTSITATAPGTPDYAIANLTSTTPFGFVSADEGQTVLTVIANLQARVNQLESRLQTYGLLA
jgi:hypothetical protein